MPHLVIYYTAQLEQDPRTQMTQLCRALADCMVKVRCENERAIFPPGGVRVFAYPAPHSAVSDGTRDDAFIYLNLRMAAGRSPRTHAIVGQALLTIAQAHFAEIFATRTLGITLQIDEGKEVFDGKHNNIHPLYAKAS